MGRCRTDPVEKGLALPTWTDDILGEGYQQHVIELGADPDGEGDIDAVLVRRVPADTETIAGVVLYVHGFSDYFFQTAMADFFAAHGLAFYALDLRKSGRGLKAGQTAHYVSDLALYDAELDAALDLVSAGHPGVPVVAAAHSTGGLIVPLWLDRRRRRTGSPAPVTALVLNSPWLDLQGKPAMRTVGTQALRIAARLQPHRVLDTPVSPYGTTLHISGTGEWDFDLALKPLEGFPVTMGWMNAIRRGQSLLHRGLDVGVPSLVLRSDRTHYSSKYSEASDRADTVLDVRQIARWAGCLGGETTVVPIHQARHDVFLSLESARKEAYIRLETWLQAHDLVG
jgi:alpha-beta hydrolase superfamily lysophospholipase